MIIILFDSLRKCNMKFRYPITVVCLYITSHHYDYLFKMSSAVPIGCEKVE